ncbi:MAG: hypothetical protein ABIL09_17865 [Gemmatimonadota bacterium]
MTEHPRRLIWFCGTEQVAERPEWLAALRDEIGLTTIMPESPVCHTSGFAASAEVAARGPFEDWRQRRELWPRGAEGIYPPVAGTPGGFDDAPLRRLMDACQKAGIEVWGHLGLWSYGGDVYPEHALVDLDGKALDRRYGQWGIGLCPSRTAVNEWVGDCLQDVAARYEVSGFCLDHARYPAPANLHSLLACGCPDCAAAAAAMGCDLDAVRQAAEALRRRIRALGSAGLERLVRARPGPLELAALVDPDGALLAWLRFRARLLARRMGELRQALVRAGRPLVFGSDVFAPSISLLGGHEYPAWEEVTDYLTGGSSYGGVVGWATGSVNAAGEWAAALCRAAPGLAEGPALELAYGLLGCRDLDLPAEVAALRPQALPLAELYSREIDRLRVLSSGRVPLYPPVTAHGDPQLVQALCRAVVEARCQGAMLGLDPENRANLQVLRQELGRL